MCAEDDAHNEVLAFNPFPKIVTAACEERVYKGDPDFSNGAHYVVILQFERDVLKELACSRYI